MQKIVSKLLRRFSETVPSHGKIELAWLGVDNNPQQVLSPPLHSEENTADTPCSEPQRTMDAFPWLYTACPAFPVNANNIQILKDPAEFYQTLLNQCKSAQYRITLASLYLGTGELEKKLVNTIRNRMQDLQGQVKVTFLFDHSRGSRGKTNSRTMVTPLLQEQPDSCQVSLYHTVALRGLLRMVIPQRYNELIGLQHMKLYVIDDTLIISGANLSHDYFTNRQDRYVVLHNCREVADFFANLVSRVCEFSFRLLPCGSTSLHSSWPPELHPYKGHHKKFVEAASSHVRSAFFSPMAQLNQRPKDVSDTWVFPTIQMNQLQLRHDSDVMVRLLENSPPGSFIHLTTGYFNLTKDLFRSILYRSYSKFSVLSAHPSANGFLNAKGLAGGIPAAYTQLSKEFFDHIANHHHQNRIEMREFIRSGWTYHGKGLWLTLPGHTLPSLTFIGSPNFGYRSLERDLEAQIAIVTSNKDLQERLADERDRLFESSTLVKRETFTEVERIVPKWVYCISWVFRNFF